MKNEKQILMTKVPFNHARKDRSVVVIRKLGLISVGEELAEAAIKAGHAEPADAKSLADMDRAELEALAEQDGIDLSEIEGTGASGNVLVDDIRNHISRESLQHI